MIDAYARERFNEARDELWKLSSIFKKKPLIILTFFYKMRNNIIWKSVIYY